MRRDQRIYSTVQEQAKNTESPIFIIGALSGMRCMLTHQLFLTHHEILILDYILLHILISVYLGAIVNAVMEGSSIVVSLLVNLLLLLFSLFTRS